MMISPLFNSRKTKFRGKIFILHLTTVHPRNDPRIRIKEIESLADRFGAVKLVVFDGKGNDTRGDITTLDLGTPPAFRLQRMLWGNLRAFRVVRRERPRVVHFHDPELIPLSILLRLFGHRVIYDVHEDVPRQVLEKNWLPVWVRRPISLAMEVLEWLAVRLFSGVVVTTPTIGMRFPQEKTTLVQNFPILLELAAATPMPYKERPLHVAYVGCVTENRGAREMVQSLALLPEAGDIRLRLAGNIWPESVRRDLEALPGWTRVDFSGWASRPQVADILGQVRAGLVVLHPIENYLESFPVKMFEYMAAGLPVIASDFPLWRQIVKGAGCGLLVDPLNPQAIADAIQWVLDFPEEAYAMGQRGRQAVENRYNWEAEAVKLINLYDRLNKT